MSLALHRLGLFVGRHRIAVVGGWMLVLVSLLSLGQLAGSQYQDDFTIPGTESQTVQEILETRFGDAASGASAQLLFRTVDGSAIAGDSELAVIAERLADVAEVSGVAGVTDIESVRISEGGDAALATVQFEQDRPDQQTLTAVHDAAVIDDGALASTIGGSAYGAGPEEIDHAAELIGIGVALLVLLITFGSMIAAGLPIVAALVGVGTTSSLLILVSHLTTISPATPAFASMLGLAVAIDYSLFILSRHRHELADGLAPREAMARALGTAGTAVVFAGLTVVVSLTGLAVVGIPMLTLMASGGAIAVGMGVLVAITLLPAVALLLGARLTPRRESARRNANGRATPGAPGHARPSLARRWVRLVTKAPTLTVLVVVMGVGAVALPATQMQLALPDASSEPVGSDQRENFDAIAETFGPGWNAALLVTVDILGSEDPIETIDGLQAEFAQMPGVDAVAVATPNEAVDTAMLRVIPDGGQNDQVTKDLVRDIRARAGALEAEYGVSDIRVTGTTAINIDISERLQAALLPFAITVVGLSFMLLLIVFRSIWVPLKATLGYLLSVGASFGAIVAVFQLGWFPALLGATDPGPLVSFLPILVMGVLFGLAMDYEMFLVSRMREDFSRTGDARGAVSSGFGHTAPVVTAAAVIMVAVFAAFVPGGSDMIKPVAFGLAVGVFVDAFLVRMTLVPAVMALLGARAWWLPRWLETRLPSVDIEGDAVMRQASLENGAGAAMAISALDVRARPGDEPLTTDIPFGAVSTLAVADAEAEAAMARALSGRLTPAGGVVAVAGQILPERGAAVRRMAAIATRDTVPPIGTGREHAERISSLCGGGRSVRRARVALVEAIVPDLDVPVPDLAPAARQALAAAVAVACGARIVFLTGPTGADLADAARREQLAELLAAAGATVVTFTRIPFAEPVRALEIGVSA